ncbi:hypothetical protein JTE88_05845 [Arcanobacterium phocisimile]|uniref:Uncharacterized protein n=1 Tax=Arcanobacterium phocisimile TaxID=1302235 RepID=A0ABX7IEQ7_9ACTO|nr:hypothetical protein [Arcanobacterium phocisimile]QRV01624.1 hypothetical protein JTE88_05845 [Arcanobacterium phocisimile]
MPQPRTSKWGYTKHKQIPALRIALPTGLIFGAFTGVICAYLRSDMNNVWLYTAIFAALTGPIFAALIWVILVDRATITGTVAKPEVSIENAWHHKAASAGFFTMFISSSWGMAIASFYQHNFATTYLAVIFFLGVSTYWVSYFVHRRRTLK